MTELPLEKVFQAKQTRAISKMKTRSRKNVPEPQAVSDSLAADKAAGWKF